MTGTDTDFVPAGLPDWFVPATERATQHTRRLLAANEPGVMNTHGVLQLHRSHLPLIENVTVGERPFAPGRGWHIPAGLTLRPWQAEAAAWAEQRAGGIIALAPRMGKTAIPFLLWDPSQGQLLIVAPLALRSVWREWSERFYPDVPFTALEGHTYDPKYKTAPILFCHYDILQYWISAFSNRPALGVFDEPHVLAGYKAERTTTCKMVQAMCKRRLVLTGTPVWNRPRELHNVLQVATGTAFGHNFRDYGLAFCNGKPGKFAWDYSGVSRAEDLRARLAEVIYARDWDDVGMPPKVKRTIVPVKVDELTIDKLDAELVDLRGKTITQVGDLATYRRLVSKIKAQAVINDLGAPKEPVVIWAWHRQTVEFLAAEFAKVTDAVYIHGGMTDPQRVRILDAWRKSDGPPVLVATIPVAQVGIDLSRASRAVFTEVDYTPLVVAQAEMRTFLPGREMDVTIYVADHMIDSRMTLALAGKLDSARKIGLPAGGETVTALVEAQAASRASEAPDMDAFARALLEDL